MIIRKRSLLYLFIASLLFLGVTAMSFSEIGKMCLFSGISGIITLDGKPVGNAKIKRVVGKAHTHGKKTDETTTNDKGYFEMPPVFDRSLIGKVLPMQFSVPQEIFVAYREKKYNIWSGVKSKREENSESSGNPLVVQCELNRDHQIVSVGGGFVSSSCTWKFEPDPPLIIDPPEDDED